MIESMISRIQFIVSLFFASFSWMIGVVSRNWQITALITVLFCLFTVFVDRILNNEFIEPYYKKLKLLVKDPRAVFGAAIAIWGTFVIYSPNIPFWDDWYNNKIKFYRNALAGLDELSTFGFELSESDFRQHVKTLSKDEIGFDEVLLLLSKANPYRVKGRNVTKITNRRQNTHEENSQQFIDVMNVMHVYDSEADPQYSLVAQESEIREMVRSDRNRSVEGLGTMIVVIGIFWQYFWQLLNFLKDALWNILILLFVRLKWIMTKFIEGIHRFSKKTPKKLPGA